MAQPSVRFLVYDKDIGSSDDFLGSVVVPFDDIKNAAEPLQFPLQSQKGEPVSGPDGPSVLIVRKLGRRPPIRKEDSTAASS